MKCKSNAYRIWKARVFNRYDGDCLHINTREARKLGYLTTKKIRKKLKIYASYKKRDGVCDPFVGACEGKRKDHSTFH